MITEPSPLPSRKNNEISPTSILTLIEHSFKDGHLKDLNQSQIISQATTTEVCQHSMFD